MPEATLAATPPTGVAKESIWKQLVTKTKQLNAKGAALDKIKTEGTRVLKNVGMVAIEGGTAIGSGILFAKFPQIAKIPGTDIEVQLVAGGILTVVGVLLPGAMGEGLGNVGRGLLVPWLYAKGLEIGEKI